MSTFACRRIPMYACVDKYHIPEVTKKFEAALETEKGKPNEKKSTYTCKTRWNVEYKR